ncbi:hypothetical protein H4582DRAFT_1895034 [Lactarius indigo]|nr:hypothetical protein H4582DRAFT_1895034 [Lactarius indigo]
MRFTEHVDTLFPTSPQQNLQQTQQQQQNEQVKAPKHFRRHWHTPVGRSGFPLWIALSLGPTTISAPVGISWNKDMVARLGVRGESRSGVSLNVEYNYVLYVLLFVINTGGLLNERAH